MNLDISSFFHSMDSLNTDLEFMIKIFHCMKLIREDAIIRNVIFSKLCLKISSFFIILSGIYHHRRRDEVYLEFMGCSLEEIFPIERHFYLVLDERHMIEVLLLILGLQNWSLSKWKEKAKSTKFQNHFPKRISSLKSVPGVHDCFLALEIRGTVNLSC